MRNRNKTTKTIHIIRGVFKTQSNIYDETFSLFSQKSSILVVRLGSKYASAKQGYENIPLLPLLSRITEELLDSTQNYREQHSEPW